MNKSKVRGLKWNLKKLKGSVLHFTQKKNMDNLYFIPNNILTNFFKELTKKKRLSIAFFLASPTKTHAFIIIKS